MLPVTIEDIAIANTIAPEVLGRSLDELPPQTRRLLDEIKKLVLDMMKQKVCEQSHCLFSRRQLRERSGWSQPQIRRHLERLSDLEYVAIRHGCNGISLQYELLIDAGARPDAFHIGLIDPKKLNARAASHRQRRPPGRGQGRA